MRLRFRRIVASALMRLPWTCHALLIAWGETGGLRLLLDGLRPGASRRCMRDAADVGHCYCYRFVTVGYARPVYEATRHAVEVTTIEG